MPYEVSRICSSSISTRTSVLLLLLLKPLLLLVLVRGQKDLLKPRDAADQLGPRDDRGRAAALRRLHPLKLVEVHGTPVEGSLQVEAAPATATYNI